MRKIARSVEEKVLRRWLEGNSQRHVASEFGVGLATVNRVIQDANKKMQDIEGLRQLNLALQKSGIIVVDAIRACSILQRLDELDIGVNEITEYMELSKKLAVKPELLQAAFKTQKLERETGKSFEEVSEEFEEKATKLKALEGKLQILRAESKNAEKQRQVAELCEQMKATGVEPGRLKEFINRKGSLEKQLRSLEEEIKQGKARLSILARMEKDLQRSVNDVQRIEHILRSRMTSFACPRCGGVTLREVRRSEVQLCLSWGQPLTIVCQRCLTPNQYDPRTLLLNLGLEVLS